MLYSLLVVLLLPLAFVHLLWRARRQPEYLHHWSERLGHFKTAVQNAPLIWIHAVSVGETRAAQPLVSELRRRYPQHQILITHTTPTGRATSELLFGDTVLRSYLPYDTAPAVRRFLAHFRPQFGLIMETELWPNLISICRERPVPVLLINARMSEKSARRYARFAGLTRKVLQDLSAVAAISPTDLQRLTHLGAGGRQTLEVTGNMKFDIRIPPEQQTLGASFRERFGQRDVFLAASTREGEEILLLDTWVKAWLNARFEPTPVGAGETKKETETTKQQGGRAQNALCAVACGNTPSNKPLLVLVPRHPQRFAEVAQLIEARGLLLQRRSAGEEIRADTDVLLGDSMGEMFAWYVAADVAFIGGSLLDFGSQNLIEACAVGTPVLLGPSTFNFAEAASEAIECGAAHSIADASDLVHQGLAMLKDPALRSQMSSAGQAFAQRHRGATERTLEIIERAIR